MDDRQGAGQAHAAARGDRAVHALLDARVGDRDIGAGQVRLEADPGARRTVGEHATPQIGQGGLRQQQGEQDGDGGELRELGCHVGPPAGKGLV
jgi:hypothetical protein